jgi:hypothetical protein
MLRYADRSLLEVLRPCFNGTAMDNMEVCERVRRMLSMAVRLAARSLPAAR